MGDSCRTKNSFFLYFFAFLPQYRSSHSSRLISTGGKELNKLVFISSMDYPSLADRFFYIYVLHNTQQKPHFMV
jgi:hypothetical protein